MVGQRVAEGWREDQERRQSLPRLTEYEQLSQVVWDHLVEATASDQSGMCVRVYVRVYIICMRACVYVCVRVFVCTYMCVCMCLCVHVCLRMCVGGGRTDFMDQKVLAMVCACIYS